MPCFHFDESENDRDKSICGQPYIPRTFLLLMRLRKLRIITMKIKIQLVMLIVSDSLFARN